MGTEKQTVEVLRLRTNIGLGALVGLMAGFLLGARDSIFAITLHAPRPFPLSKILSFSIYPIASYALIGCLVMAVLGVVITMLMRSGGYTVSKATLAGIYVGISALLAVSVVGSGVIGVKAIEEKPHIVGELTVVGMLCGLALATLTVYILKKVRRDRLIAICISLFVSLLIFSHIALWTNRNLRFGFFNIRSASDFGLLILIGFLVIMAVCLYLLSLSILRKDRSEAGKEKTVILLAAFMVGSGVIGLLEAISRSFVIVGELSLVSTLCGIALGGLTIYILRKVRRDRLIAVCISISVSLLVFLYMGLWMNMGLLPGMLSPIGLLSHFGLLILVGFLATGLYLLALSIPRRRSSESRKERYIALGLLSAVTFVFLAIALIIHFNNQDVEARRTSVSSESKGLGSPKDRPNILWIVMDTARADHLSCYGYNRKTTPNIDRIASEGVLFENAISAAPWTLPSHASMFTGMFPSRHGADGEHVYLADEFLTIAEVLSSHGYRTFGYSNNHFLYPYHNLTQGFGTLEVTEWGRKFRKELADSLLINAARLQVPGLVGTSDAGAHRTNRMVEKWITDSHNSNTSFFIFINYMEVHSPYGDTPYSGHFLGSTNRKEAGRANQNPYPYISGKVEMSDRDFEMLRALYDGDMLYLDYRMNQLFDHLRQLGIMDDTVLIITSDHGENFGEHRLLGHVLCVYDTLLHIPLIIRYPKLFPPKLRIQEQVQTVDILPTILDIVGIDRSEAQDIQGHSLLQAQNEQHGSPFTVAEIGTPLYFLHDLIAESIKFDTSGSIRRLKTIRTDEFKYIWSSDGRDELYNIREDPGELNNLIEIRSEDAKKLKDTLGEWLDSFEHYGHR